MASRLHFPAGGGSFSNFATTLSSGPKGLIFDNSGMLWFTMQNANRIGRLDPNTGEIKLLTPPTAGT